MGDFSVNFTIPKEVVSPLEKLDHKSKEAQVVVALLEIWWTKNGNDLSALGASDEERPEIIINLYNKGYLRMDITLDEVRERMVH